MGYLIIVNIQSYLMPQRRSQAPKRTTTLLPNRKKEELSTMKETMLIRKKTVSTKKVVPTIKITMPTRKKMSLLAKIFRSCQQYKLWNSQQCKQITWWSQNRIGGVLKITLCPCPSLSPLRPSSGKRCRTRQDRYMLIIQWYQNQLKDRCLVLPELRT